MEIHEALQQNFKTDMSFYEAFNNLKKQSTMALLMWATFTIFFAVLAPINVFAFDLNSDNGIVKCMILNTFVCFYWSVVFASKVVKVFSSVKAYLYIAENTRHLVAGEQLVVRP